MTNPIKYPTQPFKVTLTDEGYSDLQVMMIDHRVRSASELVRKLVSRPVPTGTLENPRVPEVGKPAPVSKPVNKVGTVEYPVVPDDAAEVRFLIGKKSYDTMVGWGIDVISVCKTALKEEYAAEVGKRKK